LAFIYSEYEIKEIEDDADNEIIRANVKISDSFDRLLQESDVHMKVHAFSGLLKEYERLDDSIKVIFNVTNEFIKSRYYAEWRAESNGFAAAAFSEALYHEHVESISRSNSSAALTYRIGHMNSDIAALNVIEEGEYSAIINASSWLSQLIATVEDASICFCLGKL
jgi:hypothetical protein